MRAIRQKLISLGKILCGTLLVFTLAGLVSTKIISLKLSQKIAEKRRKPASEIPLFFYNSIGATPALQPSKDVKFNSAQKFTVEVGYTRTRSAAEKVIDRLNQSGFPIFMTPVQLKNGKVAYKIRMGLFTNQQNAKNATIVLRERTKYKGRLIALN